MNALIVVDIQNDFLPAGTLEVRKGDEIIPLVNRLQPRFDLVVATQDWHPADHASFAANHSNRKVGETIDWKGLPQILWPMHCVQGSPGAAFHRTLNTDQFSAIIRKGMNRDIDSYSGFFDNGQSQATGLHGYLHGRNVREVYVCGLATDYCVKWTALDAKRLGFETYIIRDAARPVNIEPDDEERALQDLASAGVSVLASSDLHS